MRVPLGRRASMSTEVSPGRRDHDAFRRESKRGETNELSFLCSTTKLQKMVPSYPLDLCTRAEGRWRSSKSALQHRGLLGYSCKWGFGRLVGKEASGRRRRGWRCQDEKTWQIGGRGGCDQQGILYVNLHTQLSISKKSFGWELWSRQSHNRFLITTQHLGSFIQLLHTH